MIIDTSVKITNKNHTNENRNTEISVREANLSDYHQNQFQHQSQREHKKNYHYLHELNSPRQTFSSKIRFQGLMNKDIYRLMDLFSQQQNTLPSRPPPSTS